MLSDDALRSDGVADPNEKWPDNSYCKEKYQQNINYHVSPNAFIGEVYWSQK